jgi:uncharacterized membrane protein
VQKFVRVTAIAAVFLVSQAALAGIRPTNPVPTLGEAGLAVFAISLLGGGVALIRRRRR